MRNNRTDELQALSEVLDAFGADRTRWPCGAAERFALLLAKDAEAQERLAEAAALDRLLDTADAVAPAAPAGLADRIVAAAVAAPPRGARSGGSNVVVLRPPSAPRQAPVRSGWQAAALLAASLVFGVYIGVQGADLPLLEDVADGFGVASVETLSLVGEPALLQLEEETL